MEECFPPLQFTTCYPEKNTLLFKNYWKTDFRCLKMNKGFTITDVLGLARGISRQGGAGKYLIQFFIQRINGVRPKNSTECLQDPEVLIDKYKSRY